MLFQILFADHDLQILLRFASVSLLPLRLLSLGKDIDTSLAVRADRRLSIVALLEPFRAHTGRSDVAVKDLGRQRDCHAGVGDVDERGDVAFDWSGAQQQVDLLDGVAQVAEVLHRVERGLLCGCRRAHGRLRAVAVDIDAESFERELSGVVRVDRGRLACGEYGTSVSGEKSDQV